LIVDLGDGELARYPVKVDGDAVTFGDRTLVTEEYPDKAVAAEAVMTGMALADPSMVIHASRAETDDRPVNPTQEGGALTDEQRKKLAASLSLPEDATEEQIHAKLVDSAIAASEAPPEDEPPPADDGEGEGEGEGEGTETGSAEGVEASATVSVDRATLEELKAGAALAIQQDKERKKERIAAAVKAAVADGRIPPARRKHWSDALAADFDGNIAVLEGLEPDLIPLSARGDGGGNHDGEGVETNAAQALPDSWFPEIASIRARAAAGSPVLQAREG
jgi:Mu-like prophage I protein